MFDARFKSPSSWLIAGPSSSGKTTFVFHLLEHFSKLFESPERVQNVLYFYKTWQQAFSQPKNSSLVSEFIEGLPTVEMVVDKTISFQKQGGSIIIIDDFMQETSPAISLIFTALSHHRNLVVFFLSQNIFFRSSIYRDISLNATYIIVFKNPRDSQQIGTLARQISPGNSKFIVDSYKEATNKPFSYLLFDNHQTTPNLLRIRSNILPSEWPVKVWIQKNCKDSDINIYRE